MPAPSWFHPRLLLPAMAGGLCSLPHAGEPLWMAAPEQPRAVAVQPAPGVKVHYDLLTPTEVSAGPGRLEGIVSGDSGELRTSVLVNPGAEGNLARLDTRWQTHVPGLETMVVGDTFGSGGGWSRPVRFGGVRIGRGLTVRPGFVAAPQLGGTASAALPPAPLAMVGGLTGETGAALSALLSQSPGAGGPAVGVPAPLEAGATDYELEAGRLRNGWGTAGDHYGEPYAAAAYRAGLGAKLTAEARAEWTSSRSAAGLELSRGLGRGGSVHAVLARSATEQASGLRWGMGLVGNGESLTWTLSSDSFDRGFTPLAMASGEADLRARLQAGATFALWGGASAGVTYARQSTWEAPAAGLLGLTAQIPLLDRSSLSLNYSQRADTQPGWQAGVTLSVPLSGVGP